MYVPTMDELVAARISPETAQAREGMVLYRRVGCPRCNRTGYKGRIGIFQLLVMDDELEGLAARNAPREEIERAAASAGMRSLWDDGIAKAAAGLTSIEELARVVSG
jgi:type II secretory ATPase GspE/PulE/Tfp pilus assembly ATPase PilB-like protein